MRPDSKMNLCLLAIEQSRTKYRIRSITNRLERAEIRRPVCPDDSTRGSDQGWLRIGIAEIGHAAGARGALLRFIEDSPPHGRDRPRGKAERM